MLRTFRNARNAVGKRTMATIPSYATLDPDAISGSNPCKICNLEGGEWRDTKEYFTIPDPMNGEPFILVPNTSIGRAGTISSQCRGVSRDYNPSKNPERFIMYGDAPSCHELLATRHYGFSPMHSTLYKRVISKRGMK